MNSTHQLRPRILVVDDEQQITRVLKTTLTIQGYEVETANHGEAALASVELSPPDLIITDLAMPEMDGIELTRRIRDRWQIPILVLSVRDQEKTKVRALDAGADDFITKPFNMNELLARVRANLRRQLRAQQDEPDEIIDVGDFFIDPQARVVRVRELEIHLTPKEFDLLLYLARHPGRVLTQRKLLTAVWGADSVHQPEYLRVFIGQLRKKIEPDDKRRYILTEPWIGYRFNPDAPVEGIGAQAEKGP